MTDPDDFRDRIEELETELSMKSRALDVAIKVLKEIERRSHQERGKIEVTNGFAVEILSQIKEILK